MSLGSDLVSGFEATRSIREKRAERELRRRLLEQEIAAGKERQNAQLVADAERMKSDHGFRAGEAEKDRTHRSSERAADRTFTTSERIDSQNFQGGENEKGRVLSRELQMEKMRQDAAALKQAQDQFTTKFSWEKDPANPDNIYKSAHARYLDPEGAPPVPALPNAQQSLQNGRMGMPPPQAAIDHLRAHPETAEQFRAKYGVDPAKYLTR